MNPRKAMTVLSWLGCGGRSGRGNARTAFFSHLAAAGILCLRPVLAQDHMTQTTAVGASERWRPVTLDDYFARIAIDALCVEYFYRLDHGMAGSLHELYVPDGVMVIANDRQLRGRDAIAEFYAGRSDTVVTRHVTTNLRIEMIDPNHARVLRTFTYYRGESGTEGGLPQAKPAVAEYEEEVARDDSGIWYFSYRHPVSIFDPPS